MRQRKRALLTAIVAAATVLAALSQAQAKILAQWVQLGPDGASSVRAITEDACPSVIFDGAAVPMNVRSEPGQKPCQRQAGAISGARLRGRGARRRDLGQPRWQAAAAAAAQSAAHRDVRRYRLPA